MELASASVVTLFTMMLVPVVIGSPRLISNSLLWPVWFSGVPPAGV